MSGRKGYDPLANLGKPEDARRAEAGQPTGLRVGDLAYWDGVRWTRLAAGEDGRALVAAGPGAAPTWGGVPPTLVQLAADVSSTSTALADVGLSFSVAASTAYVFEFVVVFTAASSSVGLGLAINGPANAQAFTAKIAIPTGAAAETSTHVTTYDNALTAETSTGANALVARVTGLIRTGNTAGTLALRFKSEADASAVTILQGSTGLLWAA